MDHTGRLDRLPCSLLFAVVLAIVFSASRSICQNICEVPKVAPTLNATKGKTLEWTSAEGKPFWYRLPAKIDKRKPPSLIFMLHGTGLKWG